MMPCRLMLPDVDARGLTAVICDAQQHLRACGTVLAPESAEAVFAGDPEIDRICELATGCPLQIYADFQQITVRH